MIFSKLLADGAKASTSKWSFNITEDWLQGRTTYGGLSAAICLRAIENEFDDLPPLRSMQVNFIGPVAGEVEIEVTLLRRGKSVAYISAEMKANDQVATHCVCCFGTKRESRMNTVFGDTPSVPTFSESKNFFQHGPGPTFSNQFHCRLAKGGFPVSGSPDSEHFIWVKHKDELANDMPALVGIADMPPPAVLPMFKEFAPISSMTWMFNILTEDLETEDGWWLMRSAAEHSKDGYSSQDMQVWNTSGDLVLTGRQNVAIFY